MAQPILLDHGVQLAFELVGIFAFAISGAVMAIRKDFGVVGIVLLAAITALGGGVARDVVIGAIPALVRPDTGLSAVPAVAGVLAVVGLWELGYRRTWIAAGAAAFIFAFR